MIKFALKKVISTEKYFLDSVRLARRELGTSRGRSGSGHSQTSKWCVLLFVKKCFVTLYLVLLGLPTYKLNGYETQVGENLLLEVVSLSSDYEFQIDGGGSSAAFNCSGRCSVIVFFCSVRCVVC